MAGISLSGSDAGKDRIYCGYAAARSGETIEYHCFHPGATQALLTRASSGEMAIAWKTDPLPADHRGGATFIWIGAYSTGTSKGDRNFRLFLGQREMLTFHTRAGGVLENWEQPGSEGVSLAFEHAWTDRHSDAFGFFLLSVPACLCSPGEALELKLTGERADSRDWAMVFRYRLSPDVALVSPHFLFRSPRGSKQPVRIGFDSLVPSGTARIALEGSPPVTIALKRGFNSTEVLVPAVDIPTRKTVEVVINKGPVQRLSLLLKPIPRRTIYLLPHSHNDIGYTGFQEDVLRLHVKNLTDALKLIRETASFPEGSRFKWNVEVMWAVERFLAESDEGQIEEFVTAVKNGSIGLQALDAHPLSGICRPEELIHLTDGARAFRDRFGIPIRSAMTTDIPGFSWGLVPALAQAGVRYLSNGPNVGDRIGRSTQAWGDRPFWWVSPSGAEKILLWTTGTGYSFFHGFPSVTRDEHFEQRLSRYLDTLEARAYPYDIIQMRYNVVSDNGPVDPEICGFVRRWNEARISPRLLIATTDEIFAALETEYGDRIPAYAGDFSPYWEDGAISSAREVGMVKRAAERLVQGEIYATLLSRFREFSSHIAAAWKSITLFNEHTWGAWNSVSEPDDPGVRRQWEYKMNFALRAEAMTRDLFERLDAGPKEAEWVEVVNLSSWNRSGLAVLSAPLSRNGDRVLDEAGRAAPSQRLVSGELAFLAADVPALSGKRFRVVSGTYSGPGTVEVSNNRLANRALELQIDERTGNIVSLRRRGHPVELVESESSGLNAYLYTAGTNPEKAQRCGNGTIEVLEKGPLLGVLRIRCDPPGGKHLFREIRLVEGLDHVEIIDTLDKVAVRGKESVRFAFPFSVPDAVVRLDQGWGVVRPEADQLPGACRDFFCAQRWVDVANQDFGVTLGLVEAPLLEIGTMVDETTHNRSPSGWKASAVHSAKLFSLVMNNHWHTNYKADQEGETIFHYTLRPHAGFDAAATYRFGIEGNQPLRVRAATIEMPRLQPPFRLVSSGVVVTTMAGLPEGNGWLVRLYNSGGKPEPVRFEWIGWRPKALFVSNTGGEKGDRWSEGAVLPAYGLTTLRLEE